MKKFISVEIQRRIDGYDCTANGVSSLNNTIKDYYIEDPAGYILESELNMKNLNKTFSILEVCPSKLNGEYPDILIPKGLEGMWTMYGGNKAIGLQIHDRIEY